MHKLLWIIPLAIIAASIWAVMLIPTTVLAFIGGVAVVAASIAAAVFLILWFFATAMRS